MSTLSGLRVRVRIARSSPVGLRVRRTWRFLRSDEADTSLLLYLAPELVHMELAQDYLMSREEVRRYRRGALRVPKGSPGSIGRPTLASAAKGSAIYTRLRERISERIFLAPSVEE